MTDNHGIRFEKLDVYNKAIDFATKVYEITKDFPKNEIYGLSSQLRRALVSISSNIAEGSGRYNKRDFAQYLRIARGSAYECVPLLEISYREAYINKSVFNALISDCNELSKMLNGLIKSLSNT